MKRWLWLCTLVASGVGIAQGGIGGEICKGTQLKSPALGLSAIYAMAEGYAKAWQKDAVPAKITNTSLGPLQPNGSSVAWSLQFYSAQANSVLTVTTFRGSLTCSAEAGSAGRIPDLKPDFFRDGAKLYSLAQQHGAVLAKVTSRCYVGYAVTVEITQANRICICHSGRELLLRLKRTISQAQQDAYTKAIAGAQRQISIAIPVQIANRNPKCG